MSCPAWQRWSLFAAILALGTLYLATFALFVTQSRNFIVAERNERALIFSNTHIITLPARLSFGVGESADARLGGGWHLPDTVGVWSMTSDSWVELVVHKPNTDLLLHISTTAFVTRTPPRMGITGFVNEMPLGSWVRDSTNASEPLDIHVPGSLAPTGHLSVHLRTDNLASPFRLNVGSDRRRLGLLLTSIELREASDTQANAEPAVRP